MTSLCDTTNRTRSAETGGATHRVITSICVRRSVSALFVLGLLFGCKAAPDSEEPAAEASPSATQLEADPVEPAEDPFAGHPADCPMRDGVGEPASPLPGTSVFHLDHTFTDSEGVERHLADLRGAPSVFVMFYASCTTACPILVADGLRLESLLEPAVRSNVRFVYITIDPDRDDSAALSAYRERLGLGDRWLLLRADSAYTRAVAAVMGVNYRASEGGHFSHTNRISILDAEGRVVETVDGLQQPLDGAARTLTELVEGAEQ